MPDDNRAQHAWQKSIFFRKPKAKLRSARQGLLLAFAGLFADFQFTPQSKSVAIRTRSPCTDCHGFRLRGDDVLFIVIVRVVERFFVNLPGLIPFSLRKTTLRALLPAEVSTVNFPVRPFHSNSINAWTAGAKVESGVAVEGACAHQSPLGIEHPDVGIAGSDGRG